MTKSKTPHEQFDEGFWTDEAAPVIREEPSHSRVYDLEERTARFGEAVIDFAKTIPQNAVTNRIISQLVAAATSVGANYVEADDAVSKKDFLKSIGTCRKEARETKHFLRMVARGGARAEAASTPALDGDQGATFDLLKNLERSEE